MQLRISITTTNFLPDIGGPARQTAEIANELSRRGHEVQIIVSGHRERPPSLHNDISFVTLHGPKEVTNKFLRNVINFFQLFFALRRFRPDIIHNQTFEHRLLSKAITLAKQMKIPVMSKFTAERAFEVALAHHKGPTDDPEKVRTTERYKSLARKDASLLRRLDKVWVTTPEFSEHLRRKHGLPAEKIHFAPNFIDTRLFESLTSRKRAPPSTLEIVTVCRFTPWKGIEDCIAAGALLNDIDLRWTMIGSGNEATMNSIGNAMEHHYQSGRFRFVGPKSADEIAECLARADIFVLASRYEPFGIVLIEAMAAGVCIAASDVGGIPYVLNYGETGQLFEAANPDSLARAIRSLVENPSLRESFVQRGIAAKTEFEIGVGVDRLVDAYQNMLGNQDP